MKPVSRALERAYVSEFTRFMDDYLRQHPEAVREQRSGWRIWWDKRVDQETLEEARDDAVPTESYYYFGDDMPKH